MTPPADGLFVAGDRLSHDQQSSSAKIFEPALLIYALGRSRHPCCTYSAFCVARNWGAIALGSHTAVLGSIAGLTGVESLVFGKEAARASGYSDAGPYQRQSGFNNLSLGVVALVTYTLNWGTMADAALCLVLLLFLSLSSMNHLYSALREGNRSVRSFSRPLLTVALWIVVLPFMLRALGQLS